MISRVHPSQPLRSDASLTILLLLDLCEQHLGSAGRIPDRLCVLGVLCG
ncbi:MAG: hypothetical protein M3Q86_13665 [Verrucomicrobiota bacterium]|nr:hypothetical protein [Verrucomicrobiota bacterium]